MSTIEIGELKSKLTNESVVNAQLLKKINELEWQIVRLKAGHAAISEVRCKAIVESEKDTERLDWLDARLECHCHEEDGFDSWLWVKAPATNKNLRAAIDAARKEAQP